ncbi:MAG: L-histidine N(alpha)-methyltransferase [Myxococcota bacterium]
MVEQNFISLIGEQQDDSLEELAYEVLVGLSSTPKSLPSRFFYDDEGSELFRQIMRLEEYYLTDCEHEILTREATTIARSVDGPVHLVDLGAGDGSKTQTLLEAMLEDGADVVYVPIDISVGAMRGVVEAMGKRFPELPIAGVVGEYSQSLRWLAEHRGERSNLVLFLGSNIGNFPMAAARGFLGRLWAQLRIRDRLLIGFDLKKDIERLLAAYNDPQGVTAAFNLNLLKRVNRELGGNFDPEGFRHFGTYDVNTGAMKSYLVSKRKQSVYVGALQRSFEFAAWEPVHTEYSYKYLRDDIEGLAHDSGFEPVARYEDRQHWFMDALWRPRKGARLSEGPGRPGSDSPGAS